MTGYDYAVTSIPSKSKVVIVVYSFAIHCEVLVEIFWCLEPRQSTLILGELPHTSGQDLLVLGGLVDPILSLTGSQSLTRRSGLLCTHLGPWNSAMSRSSEAAISWLFYGFIVSGMVAIA